MNEKAIGKELRALTNIISRNFAKEKHKFPYGLTEMHIQILLFLFEQQDRVVVQKDIEDEFTIRKSTVSRMLRLMEQKGIIRRAPDSGDARQKRITPTEKAIALDENMSKTGKEFEAILSAGISQEDLAVFFRVIDRIKENLSPK